MSYRQELQELVNELRAKSFNLIDEEARDKARRQAEVLDFLISHTEDAIAALDAA